jgi:hypothetical protein
MNEGEAVHPDRVRIHLARVRRTLRALRAFISPKEADTPVISHLGKEGGNLASWSGSVCHAFSINIQALLRHVFSVAQERRLG